MSEISSLAYIHPDAKIGENVTIKPFTYVEGNVEIGDGCVIDSHVNILSGSRIGKNNHIYSGSIIAATPQDFRWDGSDSLVTIGDNNTIRENVIINRSIYKDGSTTIGNDSFVMAQCHISHDTQIGNCVVIGNSVKIAGNCKIDDYVILSSSVLVHERCEIGQWTLIKGGCRVNNNVPPFVIMAHNPISYFGVNAFILRKGKFTEETIDDIAKCYRHVYQSNTSPFNALIRIKSDVKESDERTAIIKFIEDHDLKIAALSLDRAM